MKTVSEEGPIVNIFGFAGQVVLVATPQQCDVKTNELGKIPVKLSLQKLALEAPAPWSCLSRAAVCSAVWVEPGVDGNHFHHLAGDCSPYGIFFFFWSKWIDLKNGSFVWLHLSACLSTVLEGEPSEV